MRVPVLPRGHHVPGSRLQRVRRGRLKVFLGAAPGVGKTYAMLAEAHRLRADGRDVVIGIVEAHGRAETAAMIGDLEVIPAHSAVDDGVVADELDVTAVLARAPEVAVVDELAHSNPPGMKLFQRWEQVEVLLDAGIDVVSTVGVEHLDSLSDVITAVTEVAPSATVPDAVVRGAEEIELVDLSEQGVRERLAAGKIYPAEQLDVSTANYFRPGNLGVLRELALLWMADRVDSAVGAYRELHGIDRPWETKERVMVAIAGTPGSESVVRRAARLAMRSKAELSGVHVRSPEQPTSASSPALRAQRDLLHRLGGRYHEVVGSVVGASLAAFAKEENITQLVVGASRRGRLASLIRRSTVTEILRHSNPIDVHIVSHERPGHQQRRRRRRRDMPITASRRAVSWGLTVAGVPVITRVLIELRGRVDLHNVLLIYLLLAVVAGGIGGTFPAVVTAVFAFLVANWYFTPPVETWTIGDSGDLLTLFTFLAMSLLVGLLVGHGARRTAEARRARAQAEALAATTAQRHPVWSSDQGGLLRQIRHIFGIDAVSVLRRVDNRWETLAWDGSRELKDPNDGTEVIELAPHVLLVMLDGILAAEDRAVLRAFGVQVVQAFERAELEREAASAEALAETDRLRTALLNAVSHDLRTPLATIKASLTSLIETGVSWSRDETQSFLRAALDETERLNRIVGRLLDASRLQAGAVHVRLRPVGIEEVVATAVSGLHAQPGAVVIDISESLPEVLTDRDLLERAVANLIENALTWSPPGHPVAVDAGEVADRIDLRISDRGPGIPVNVRETVFQPFQRMGDAPHPEGVGLGLAVARGLLEAMGHHLLIEDTPGGGTTMVIALGLAAAPADRAEPVDARSHG